MVSGIGSTRGPIIMGGLVSGLDTKGLIQQLLDARRGPVRIMQGKVALRQQESDALKDINGRLANLLTIAKKFNDVSYTQGKTATVAPGTTTGPTVSVSAGATATVGTFKVTVVGLADATRVSSPAAIGTAINSAALLKDANLGTAVTAGKFTVNGVQISVDPATDTLDAVMQRIRTSVAGSTVSLVPDSSGRNNLLQISAAAPVTLGSGADDSNFLTAMKLLSSAAGTARTSTGNLGVASTGALLASANLVTAVTPATGSFKVNGVAITYDTATDSLSTVLTRINNSTAGVTAAYDAVNDKVTLVSKTTGSVGISLENVTGNFLDAIGVRTAAQTLGKNAQFRIDTGAGDVVYSNTSNIITNAVPGVTLTLLKESTTADSVTIGQDLDGAVGRMKELVSQFNSAVDFVKTQTAFDPKVRNGTLAGDITVAQIDDTLRALVTSPIDGVTSGKRTLADLGVTFGSVGSKVGTTNTLSLDETKFRTALQTDPAGVTNVLAAFRATATLDAGGTGGIQSLSGDPNALRRPGKYSFQTTVNADSTANITATFTPTDGGAATTTSLVNVVAGSTSTTLIPGVTVTFKSTFAAGTDTVTIATPTRGIAAKLEQYLDPLTRAGGALERRQDIAKSDIDSMNVQIQKMNDRLDAERLRLQTKFANMEAALARAQQQRSSVMALAQVIGA